MIFDFKEKCIVKIFNICLDHTSDVAERTINTIYEHQNKTLIICSVMNTMTYGTNRYFVQ